MKSENEKSRMNNNNKIRTFGTPKDRAACGEISGVRPGEGVRPGDVPPPLAERRRCCVGVALAELLSVADFVGFEFGALIVTSEGCSVLVPGFPVCEKKTMTKKKKKKKEIYSNSKHNNHPTNQQSDQRSVVLKKHTLFRSSWPILGQMLQLLRLLRFLLHNRS
jgi:hypothetical protein